MAREKRNIDIGGIPDSDTNLPRLSISVETNYLSPRALFQDMNS